jgi:membrane-associated phospholipid phosphatase
MKMKYSPFIAVALTFLLVRFVDEPTVLWQRTLSKDTDYLFSKLTHLGKSEWILVPIGVYLLYLWARFRKTQFKLLYIWLSVAISGLVIQPFKWGIGRARPSKYEAEGIWSQHILTMNPNYFSMPSGHATTAMALACGLAVLYPKAKIPFIIIGIFIAFTRVVVGAHYPSDIFMGGCVGIATALILKSHFENKSWL